MKKFFLSSAVVIGFVIFSVYQRVFKMSATPVITSISSKSFGSSQTVPSNLPPTFIPSSSSAPSGQSQVLPANTATTSPTFVSGYKDGTYSGDPADAFYGIIQVQATISNGRITNVKFLQYPNDRSTSIAINSQADPILAQEAIQAQSANVDIVSGATQSSQAFIQSMQSALDKAKN